MRRRVAVLTALVLVLVPMTLALYACGGDSKGAPSAAAVAMTDYLQAVGARFYWLQAEGSKAPQVFGSKELERRDLCQRTRPMFAYNKRLYREFMRMLRQITAPPPGSGHAQLIKYAELAHQAYSKALEQTERAMRRSKEPLVRGDEALSIQESFNSDMESIVTPQYIDWLATAVPRAMNVGAFVPYGIRSDAVNYDVAPD